MTTTMTLTEATLALFTAYAQDANNWGGNPWVTMSHVEMTNEARGNLSDLVKKGLVKVTGKGDDSYIEFTTEGRALASSIGIEIEA